MQAKAPSFEAASAQLLEAAGGAYSLSEAAELLGMSRQGFHKKIGNGSALGMMVGNEIRVPKLQIERSGKGARLVPGIDRVTKLFKETEAGSWAALQFLMETDPNLGKTPVAALEEGLTEPVEQAAQAYLGLERAYALDED